MNFKLFLPLTALAMLVASCQDDNKGLTKGQGTISPEFTIDYSVTNPRTMSRAENGKETVPNAPELSSFSFHLWKDDGKFDKTYTGLGDFVDAQFPVGAYSLEAFSGDIEEEGLGKPYFAGSTTFNVYDGEQAKPTLVAKLANTAVSVEYTEAFINYFTAYSTEIHSSNGTNYITMPQLTVAGTESEWAYVKSGNIDINITVTKQNGVSGTVKAATIENALPATHYHVTIDANGGEVGNATISVSFDASTAVEPIEIDVSGDILVTPAPVLTAHGFTSGTPIEILEGDAAEGTLKVNILAQGEVASVKLNTSSPTPELSSLQGDVELLTATEEQKTALTTLGVTTKGVWSGVGQVAEIDFTNILQNLKVANGVSDHIFTITVVDKLNRTCEPVVLKIQAPKPVLVISNQQELAYGQTTAEFDFTYNGKDIQNKVKFQATNAGDDWEDCTYSSVVDNGGGSYHVVINIPLRSSDSKVRAIYNTTTSAEYTFKRKIELAAADYDVWATKATVSMSPAAMRSQVTAIYLNDVQKGTTFNDYSQFTFTGLTPGTQYTAKAVLNNGTEATVTFTTEAAAPVPNGDFETLKSDAISVTEMLMGGKYKVPPATYTPWCSFTVSEPAEWTTINNKTCNLNAATLNTWFVIPSTYSTNITATAHCPGAVITGVETATPGVYANLSAQNGNYAVVVRNVAWDNNGTNPATSGGAFNTTYYCTNKPTIANRSAGQLSLDTDFASRPTTLNGYYKYERDSQDGTENAVVTVTVLNGGTEIGKGTKELGAAAGFTEFAVPVTYSVTNKKATALKIMITSSNRAEGSIKTTDYLGRLEAWSYGAILTVDNLTFSY
ncbi:MAG: DUF4493 domain-containing protein [Bacteroidales bacterium]|nr:DUF4493 domain-containing protein [Bacteroidales bacterium]